MLYYHTKHSGLWLLKTIMATFWNLSILDAPKANGIYPKQINSDVENTKITTIKEFCYNFSYLLHIPCFSPKEWLASM